MGLPSDGSCNFTQLISTTAIMGDFPFINSISTSTHLEFSKDSESYTQI